MCMYLYIYIYIYICIIFTCTLFAYVVCIANHVYSIFSPPGRVGVGEVTPHTTQDTGPENKTYTYLCTCNTGNKNSIYHQPTSAELGNVTLNQPLLRL